MVKSNKHIVVTGGAGYIGSHVVAELLKANYQVIIIDDLSNGSKKNLFEGPEFIKGDFSNKAIWSKLNKAYKIDGVIHLAASIDGNESIKKPHLYLDNNANKTAVLLDILAELSITKLIFSSTAAVYGRQIILPISENAGLNPINPYGASKLIAEKLIQYHSHFGKLNSVILRFFNACGTTEEVDVKPVSDSSLVAQIGLVVGSKKDHLKIFGDDYDTKDGTCVRDLVHVVDIARAHINSLKYLDKNTQSQIFNVGSGSGYTVAEIIKAAEQVTDKTVRKKVVKRREDEIPVSIADTQAIQRTLNFKLKYKTIQSILKSIL